VGGGALRGRVRACCRLTVGGRGPGIPPPGPVATCSACTRRPWRGRGAPCLQHDRPEALGGNGCAARAASFHRDGCLDIWTS